MSERKKGGTFVQNGNESVATSQEDRGWDVVSPQPVVRTVGGLVVGQEIAPEDLDRIPSPTDGSAFA